MVELCWEQAANTDFRVENGKIFTDRKCFGVDTILYQADAVGEGLPVQMSVLC